MPSDAPETDYLAILDVGHGNCAVLVDKNGVVVFDAGPGCTWLQFLTAQGIERIDVVLISHAHQDHIGGIVGLLTSQRFDVGCVRVNTDSAKKSKLWDDLVFVLDDLDGVDFKPELVRDNSGQFDQGSVAIEILAPSKYLASKGPGSVDREQRRVTSNTISAVVRLCANDRPVVLLAGDIDDVALENMLENEVDVNAPIVVFPHHGGRPGTSDARLFTRRLCEAVKPTTVIFSIGPGLYGTPRQDIVAEIQSVVPGVRIACTQLSEHCAASLPGEDPSHLVAAHSRGREARRCCAGTLIVRFPDGAVTPSHYDHGQFIDAWASSALCR